jgi:hypothetical protein
MHKKLAQTNKKINEVKQKCTKAARHCLEMQLQNVRAPTELIDDALGREKTLRSREKYCTE